MAVEEVIGGGRQANFLSVWSMRWQVGKVGSLLGIVQEEAGNPVWLAGVCVWVVVVCHCFFHWRGGRVTQTNFSFRGSTVLQVLRISIVF